MEVHADDRDALVRLRLDVLDADDVRGERSLEVRDDARLHLLGRQPVVLPDDADDRKVDVREDVDRHRRDRDATQQGDEQRDDHEGVRPPQCESDDPHSPHPGPARVDRRSHGTSPTYAWIMDRGSVYDVFLYPELVTLPGASWRRHRAGSVARRSACSTCS